MSVSILDSLGDFEAQLRKDRDTPRAFSCKPYEPTNKLPLPQGMFYLVIEPQTTYMGQDAGLEIGEGFDVVNVHASIRFDKLDSTSHQEGTKIGSISGFVVQGFNENFQDACDCISEELHQMAKTLFDEQGCMDHEEFMYTEGTSVLYIDYLYLDKEFRGYGLSLAAIRYFIDQIPKICGNAIIISPCPLNPRMIPSSAHTANADEPYDRSAICQKLETLYRHLGFQKVSTEANDEVTGVSFLAMVGGCDEFYPRAADLLPHLFLGDVKPISFSNERAEKRARKGGRMAYSGFPRGYLCLELKPRKVYFGKYEHLNDNNNLPIIPIDAHIKLLSGNDIDCGGEGVIIGSLTGYMVQVGRMLGEKVNFHQMNQELGILAHTMYNDLGDVTKIKGRLGGDPGSLGDLMYISNITVDEAYRGHRISLLAIDALFRTFPSFMFSHVILSPHSHISKTNGVSSQSASKLEKHFERFGFDKWSTDEEDKRNGKGFWGYSQHYGRPPMKKVVPQAYARRSMDWYRWCDEEDGEDEEDSEESKEEDDEDSEEDEEDGDENGEEDGEDDEESDEEMDEDDGEEDTENKEGEDDEEDERMEGVEEDE